jgi:hypothetical protein
MSARMTPDQALAALASMSGSDFPDAVSGSITETQYEQFIADGRRAAGRPSLTGPGTHSPQMTLRLPDGLNSRLADFAERTGRGASATF